MMNENASESHDVQQTETESSLPEDQLRLIKYALKFAIHAPSGHNTQPWLFRLVPNGIHLLADRTRALPVVDPHDRELVISCGACLYYLRIALQHYGYASLITLLPDEDQPDLLAAIQLHAQAQPNEDQEQLFSAIYRRHTNRTAFESRAVETDLQAALVNDVEAEGCWIRLIDRQPLKHQIVDLICEGDRIQAADPRFRRELAAWIHSNRSASRDGMPGYTLGVGDFASHFGPFMIRTFDWGDGQAAKDRQLAEGSPLLAILGTETDSPRSWLQCGQALAHVVAGNGRRRRRFVSKSTH